MVTRAEAVQAIKSANVQVTGDDLNYKKVHELLKMARQLEPRQNQLVVAEVATHLCLNYIKSRGPFYPDFESFLWSHFAEKVNFEFELRKLIGTGQINAEAVTIYSDYLRSMFDASGKTRSDFYGEMAAEAGAQKDLESPDFGDGASRFCEKVVNSVHGEHLLVLYSVKLVLKLHEASFPGGNAPPIADEKLDLAYRYFERGIPLEDTFLDYAEDDVFLSYSLEQGDLSEIK